MDSNSPDGVLMAEAYGGQKENLEPQEMTGETVPLRDVKKHGMARAPTTRMEMDAASPERNRFHELDVDN